VKHLDDGTLRRFIDEPAALDAPAREHAGSCAVCRKRAEEIAANAQFTANRLSGDVEVSAMPVLERLQRRLEAPPTRAAWYRPLAACAAAAAFVLALFFTPLGGYARSLLTIFEPQQFQPIDVTQNELQDLHLLPHAGDIGTIQTLRKAHRTYYAAIDGAQKHLAFTVLRPAVLPAHFGTVHSFFTMTPSAAAFTFSARKARAFEARSHKTLPPMPPALDGTSVRIDTGSVFNAHYEGSGPQKQAFFELIEAQAPRVTSSGAPPDVLENYVLSMPNIAPQLASQIRALRDIRTTVPVPVRIDKQSAHRVEVQGVQGLAVGDNTGLGAGVMWQKNGIVYVVAGPLSMKDVLAVANGLR
jgi:hypothetical protein